MTQSRGSHRPFIAFARRLYRAIPFRPVRALLFNSYLRTVRGRRVTSTVDGLTFDFDLGEMIDVALYLGEYERDVVRAIETHCRKGWTVLDIGANIGAHALRLARAVGESGRVFAFEPTTYAYAKLVRNLSLNPYRNIEAEKLALSNVSSDARLKLKASWRTDGLSVGEEETVALVRLDDWRRARGVDRVDLIKLDVDGAEFNVLAGGRESIERFRPSFLIEAGRYHFENPETNPFELLRSLGYAFSNARSLRNYSGLEEILLDCSGVDSINVIAVCHPERAS